MTDTQKIADLLFPEVSAVPADLEEKYTPRALPEGARVTRFSPSPTGYLHIGGLFGALADYMTAKATGGVFYLRIEDTDKKREIEDGVSGILEGLRAFGITPDEGVTGFDSATRAFRRRDRGESPRGQTLCSACYLRRRRKPPRAL